MAAKGTAVDNDVITLRVPHNLREVLRRHAFERNVSLNGLATDILTLWAVAATDPSDPMFTIKAMGVMPPDAPPERYPGYRDSLIFTLPKETNG